MQEYRNLFETLGTVATRPGRDETEHDEATVRINEPEVDLHEQSLQWTPELSLMLAILEDAVACYRQTLKRPRQNPEILARQAEFWIRLDDWDSPFSFNNVCEALLLDPAAMRERVFRSRMDRKNAA